MHKTVILPVVAGILMTGAAAAADLPSAIAMVNQAITKGYGADCDLAMRPNAEDAYYPCIDIGPYRFVVEYGRIRGFVLVPDQDPFEILLSDVSGARFTVQGNWMTDLPSRVEGWWLSLGTASAQPDRAAAAGDAVSAYLKSLEPVEPVPPEQPAQSQPTQPQVFYIVPPNYGQQPATTPLQPTQQIPSGFAPTANGGVLLAPGVVGYPVAGPGL